MSSIKKKRKKKKEKDKLGVIVENLKDEVVELNEKKEEGNNLILETYKIPREYIKSIVGNYNRSLVLLGGQGTGKTYLARQVLTNEKARFMENRGVNSPMALYKYFYEHNEPNLILMFDDTLGLINNPNAFSILLNILWEGKAQWNTTDGRLEDVPTSFDFLGKIIFIANRLESRNAEILKSRCLLYEINLSNDEIIQMMYYIAGNLKHKKIPTEERIKIVDFIRGSIDDRTIGVDLRTQKKIEQLYLYDKDNYQSLSMPLLERKKGESNKTKEKELLKKSLEENPSVERAFIQWRQQTGRSRKTFFTKKKELLIGRDF
jgi:hypothetical protein